jgi:hypothetical protein
MSRVRGRRLDKLLAAIDALPIPRRVVQKAFERFCDTGELPEQQRFAAAITKQAINGGQPPPSVADDLASHIRMARLKVVSTQGQRDGAEPQLPPVREFLFDEAVYGPGFIRKTARAALRLLVFLDGEVTDPQLGADKGLPKFASIGMHILGFPERLARPPYVKQARRLFLRYDALREQIDHEDRDWWWELEEAVFAFSQEGVLPEDELMRDAVLADAEMDALFRHSRGRDVGEQMALLDAAARARGAKREAAIERVQHFVRAGIAAGVVG